MKVDLKSSNKAKHKKNKYRSGFERRIAECIIDRSVPLEYETLHLKYTRPQTYTPDFILKNGIIIEAKGRFLSSDRTKHLLVKAQHPDLDIRFLFSRDQPLSKGSKTFYSDWCNKHGFKYHVSYEGQVPKAWLKGVVE